MEPKKYRKKPVVVEAFQYDGDLMGSDGQYYVPDWAVKAYEEGTMYYDSLDGGPPCELFICTLEGHHHASVDDYIIRGVEGELYPCKPDIFEKTYEECGQTIPLTVEQLMQMDGEPVWVVDFTDGICDSWQIIEDTTETEIDFGGRCGSFSIYSYGKTWLAYATKPEAEDTP